MLRSLPLSANEALSAAQLLFVNDAHGHSVEACVNVDDVARNAAREVRKQEGSRVADFLNRHRTAERRRLFHHMEELREALDAGGGKRLDGTGGNGVRADAFAAEAGSQVAGRGFKRRLGKAHRVVVGNNAFAAEIGERENGRLTALHEGKERLRKGGIGISGDIHRDVEGFARDAFKEVAGNRFARRKADRMHEAVEVAPLFFKRFHCGVNLLILRHIDLENDVAAEFSGEVLETLTEAFVRIREGEFRAFAMAGLSDAVGDGTVGNHARDQNLLAGEEAHAGSLGKNIV